MRKFLWIFLILLIVAAGIGYYGYNAIFAPNVTLAQDEQLIRIPTGFTYEDVLLMLEDKEIIDNSRTFDQVASLMDYKSSSIRSGQYEIKNNWSNKELVGLLRSGRQTPVNVTFNNLRKPEDVAGKISSYLEIDSLTLKEYFEHPSALEKAGLTPETFLSLFIPNTYQMYWNVSKEDILDRMITEHDKFWSKENRLKKAEKLNLTPEEVYTLASIVEKESLRNDEKTTIAGVYLNRLKQGIPLQADPTVVFATGEFDLRRVLNKHLAYDSPYNTYLYAGLPPGPIYMPSISSIDGVLNYNGHDYLYFCANPDQPGGHLFAASLSEHNRNAARYHRWLNARGIR
ncbi:endolytic transglycosylase MltG [Portibacter marinus]|uniref:endolytic transglycosylase MltG n=1 Tax=Portibacter marinus TaxID=2898660 RepID=UPI001F24E733|nr:endolytic transglycosylase MltG [Portibacter marinus]